MISGHMYGMVSGYSYGMVWYLLTRIVLYQKETYFSAHPQLSEVRSGPVLGWQVVSAHNAANNAAHTASLLHTAAHCCTLLHISHFISQKSTQRCTFHAHFEVHTTKRPLHTLRLFLKTSNKHKYAQCTKKCYQIAVFWYFWLQLSARLWCTSRIHQFQANC